MCNGAKLKLTAASVIRSLRKASATNIKKSSPQASLPYTTRYSRRILSFRLRYRSLRLLRRRLLHRLATIQLQSIVCQARLILEYDELNEHYELCINRLQSLLTELDSLRRENDALRFENSDLLKLIHLSTSSSSSSSSVSSPPPIHNHNRQFRHQISDFAPIHKHHSRSAKRNSLPKSISVRSPGYLKINQGRSHGFGATDRQTSQLSNTDSVSSQKVCVATKEREALELEVYRQGMTKTELCNKWQETGACPYGDNCQFAHGIDELRPVIRHPRYKTEVCRMIVTGAACPYGHRCHFRHSLTDQERMMMMMLTR